MGVMTMFKTNRTADATPTTQGIPETTTETLEDVLLELAKWGSPRVGQYGNDGTWQCTVECNVTPVGVKFEAKSDYKQTTPLAAALMCRKNLMDAVKVIGGRP